jgi:UDP-N-acetylglucosamine 1-carboxyvinyltransferase
MTNLKIVINGKYNLIGRVRISGAKNAALPELAATILSSKPFEFQNVPVVEDIKVMLKALQNLGAQGDFKQNTIQVCLESVKSALVPRDIVETSRASILILGPLLARNGYAKVSKPGGCPIGDRRFDYHLNGLRKMGADITVDSRHIIAKADKLCGIEFKFPAKTVTGTENILMAATLAQGPTVLNNCATEPEVHDLINLLKKMGASIRIENGDRLLIDGQSSLNGCCHRVIPDRIEMGTYIIAGGMLDNEIIIENAVPEYIESLIEILKVIGVEVAVDRDKIKVCSNGNLSAVEVETRPFPGFPTDLQAQLTTLLTQVRGVSRIRENIFNNRFQHVRELNRLGADIEVKDNVAVIRGKTSLTGRNISATDLRASAALVLGGLIAEGDTVIDNAHQLFRGYEGMPEKLKQLGARLEIVRDHPVKRSHKM